MTVTVDNVRIYLKNLPLDFVGDETIEMQIDTAEWVISKEKSASATVDDLDKAILLRACYSTIIAYMSEAERALGVLPPSLVALLQQLEFESSLAMMYIKRGTPISLRLFNVSESIWSYAANSVSGTEDPSAQDRV